MITLGIETSCDETALALIETRTEHGTLECRVIQSLVHSQAELHSAYGGVYPSLAKREHGKNLVPLTDKLLNESLDALKEIEHIHSKTKVLSDAEYASALELFAVELKGQNPELIETLTHAHFLKNVPAIDRIAVTEGPGLEPALWTGIVFSRFLSSIWKIPVVPVNHMEGHVVGSLLESDAPYGTWQKLKDVHMPALAFLISGGHTELVKVEAKASSPFHFEYTIIGQTKDDAVGEAFDKTARLLGLPYPGGPHIAKLAHKGWEEKIPAPVSLPRPMLKSKDLDFSFSGLKTAVLYAVRANTSADGKLTDEFKKGIAHEFETAVAETLDTKLRMAIEETGAGTLIIGGGVSANHVLRKRFEATAAEYGIPLYLPSRHISGDNALMIALAGAMDSKTYTKELKAHGTKKLGN